MINASVHRLFPTVVMEFDLSEVLTEENVQTLKDLDKKADFHGLIPEGTSTYATMRSLLEQEETKFLDEILHSCVNEYCNVMNLQPVAIGNCWTNFTTEGAYVKLHRHEGSVISGALYIQSDFESVDLTMHSPLRPYRMYDLFHEENFDNSYYAHFKPKPLTLYIFPSWIDHETQVEYSKATRQVISFNTKYIEMERVENG